MGGCGGATAGRRWSGREPPVLVSGVPGRPSGAWPSDMSDDVLGRESAGQVRGVVVRSAGTELRGHLGQVQADHGPAASSFAAPGGAMPDLDPATTALLTDECQNGVVGEESALPELAKEARVTGVSSKIAIPNTVFDVVNFGYRVVVPADAIAGVPASCTAEVIRNSLSLVATTTTSDALLAQWTPRHPEQGAHAEGRPPRGPPSGTSIRRAATRRRRPAGPGPRGPRRRGASSPHRAGRHRPTRPRGRRRSRSSRTPARPRPA